jgi:hypothetical protein
MLTCKGSDFEDVGLRENRAVECVLEGNDPGWGASFINGFE